MKILVTGGAGFIGSHIVDTLVQAHEVTVVDDLSCGNSRQINEKATFYEFSIIGSDIENIIAAGAFDTIIHCAAQKAVRVSFDNPLFDAKQNVIGLLHVLHAAEKNDVQNIIFLSTGGTIYGDASEIPTKEAAPVQPQSPYTITKRTGELYMQYYADRYDMNCVSLRLANVFGPRQDPSGEAGVVAIFLERFFAGESLRIYGDGKQTRDYIYVNDVVAACTQVLKNTNSKISGIYNIGTGRETSVLDIVSLVEKSADSKISFVHEDAIVGELKRSAIDSTLFSKVFDWTPKISLEEGIEKTFKWFAKEAKID